MLRTVVVGCAGDMSAEGGKQTMMRKPLQRDEAAMMRTLADFADMLTPGLFRIEELQQDPAADDALAQKKYGGVSSSPSSASLFAGVSAAPDAAAESSAATNGTSLEVLPSMTSSFSNEAGQGHRLQSRQLRIPRHQHPLSIATTLVAPWTQHIYGRSERFWMTSRRHLLWRGLSQAQVGTQTTVDARSYASVFTSLLSIFVADEKLCRGRVEREELSQLAALYQTFVFACHAMLELAEPVLLLIVQENDERLDISNHEDDNLLLLIQEGLWWPIHAAFVAEQLQNAQRKYVQSAVAYEALLDVEVLVDL